MSSDHSLATFSHGRYELCPGYEGLNGHYDGGRAG